MSDELRTIACFAVGYLTMFAFAKFISHIYKDHLA